VHRLITKATGAIRPCQKPRKKPGTPLAVASGFWVAVQALRVRARLTTRTMAIAVVDERVDGRM